MKFNFWLRNMFIISLVFLQNNFLVKSNPIFTKAVDKDNIELNL